MFRPLMPRVTSLSLMLAVGFSLPAWELQHATSHRDSGHSVSVHAGPGIHSQVLDGSLTAHDHDPDHEHLTIQALIKPSGELSQADIPIPATAPEFRAATVTVVIAPVSTPPARASPSHNGPSQPRAPPLT